MSFFKKYFNRFRHNQIALSLVFLLMTILVHSTNLFSYRSNGELTLIIFLMLCLYFIYLEVFKLIEMAMIYITRKSKKLSIVSYLCEYFGKALVLIFFLVFIGNNIDYGVPIFSGVSSYDEVVKNYKAECYGSDNYFQCFELGKHYNKTKMYEEAYTSFKKSCDFGFSKGCIEAARVFISGKLQMDEEKKGYVNSIFKVAINYYKSDPWLYNLYGEFLEMSGDIDKAKDSFEKAVKHARIRGDKNREDKYAKHLNRVEKVKRIPASIKESAPEPSN